MSSTPATWRVVCGCCFYEGLGHWLGVGGSFRSTLGSLCYNQFPHSPNMAPKQQTWAQLMSWPPSHQVCLRQMKLIWCRQDNNPPHESFVESDSRARMSYHNHPKSHLHSIT